MVCDVEHKGTAGWACLFFVCFWMWFVVHVRDPSLFVGWIGESRSRDGGQRDSGGFRILPSFILEIMKRGSR